MRMVDVAHEVNPLTIARLIRLEEVLLFRVGVGGILHASSCLTMLHMILITLSLLGGF